MDNPYGLYIQGKRDDYFEIVVASLGNNVGWIRLDVEYMIYVV